MGRYDFKNIEAKWRKKWEEDKTYQPDMATPKKPFYNLMMFPYPSAEGMHMGNMRTFAGIDAYGRFKRLQGHDVFQPIGLDGFGIHAENYAIKIGKHPADQAKVTEKRFYDQFKLIGNGFPWDHALETYDPEYYRWTQWLFIQMFKNGLAEKKASTVNWCPSCKTVLADEQVIDGKCERCGSETTQKKTEQWFFKITEYADRLLDNVEKIDWPEKIKSAQRNWIGRSFGTNVKWKVQSAKLQGQNTGDTIETFTTRIDTIFGATFLVIAPDHPLLETLEISEEAQDYVTQALKKTEQARKIAEKDKTGADTGLRVVHPFTGEELPVWTADFVLMDYGTGAIMGVPAHDERDFEFATKFGLEIRQVVTALEGASLQSEIFAGEGKLQNSGEFDGLTTDEGKEAILAALQEKSLAEKQVNYHLRDWLISRQRYWGPPIPMVFCQTCADASKGTMNAGWYPVSEKQLPVELPYIEDYKPTGDGKSPLEKAPEEWLYTTCPKCGSRAKRETDVSDTFLDSSWYFLAYPNLLSSEWENGPVPFEENATNTWLPVNAYIGGAEHAVLHLLYSRFVTMALHDWDFLHFSEIGEPFPYLVANGLLIREGVKMSKSKGNVIVPDEYIEKFGADAVRLYLAFTGPFESDGDFRDAGMESMARFVGRVWELYVDSDKIGGQSTSKVLAQLHRGFKKVAEDINRFKHNTAVSTYMEIMNAWREEGETLSKGDAAKFLQILSPFAPFMTEELWQHLKQEGSIHHSAWPEYDPTLLVSDTAMIVIQVNGKVRGTLELSKKSETYTQAEIEAEVKDLEPVQKYLAGKEIRKIIYVPDKLINFVI